MHDSNGLKIVVPNMGAHLTELVELLAQVFHAERVEKARPYIRQLLSLPEWYSWEDSRIGVLDGKIVTHYGIYRYAMRAGGAQLITAGVGGVATHPDYRKRGLMHETASASVAAFHAAGYDISLLFGINDYYERFGYVRAWSDRTYTLQGADLKASSEPPVTDVFFGDTLPDGFCEAYNRYASGLSGAAVRPTHAGRWLNSDPWEGVLWRDHMGEIAGALIIRFHEECMEVVDHFGDPETTLAVLGHLARERGKKSIRVPQVHENDPLAQRLRLGSCEVSIRRRRNGGALVRTVNLRGCLNKLLPSFSKRLQNSFMAGWEGTLALSDGRETCALQSRSGQLSLVADVGAMHRLNAGDYMASLIIGAEEPADTLLRGEVSVSGDAACLVGVLFPNLYPAMPAIDRF